MKASEVIRQMQSDVASVKARGDHHAAIACVEAYLATALRQVQENELACDAAQAAQNEHHREVWKARLAADTDHAIEMFKSVVESGQTALRVAVGINAGAAAALLAFAGNAITKAQALPGDTLLSGIGHGLAYFIAGMACAGFACGVRYLAQLTYSECPAGQQRCGLKAFAHSLNYTAIALGAASFVAFCAGGHSTYAAIAKPTNVSTLSEPARAGAEGDPLPSNRP